MFWQGEFLLDSYVILECRIWLTNVELAAFSVLSKSFSRGGGDKLKKYVENVCGGRVYFIDATNFPPV